MNTPRTVSRLTGFCLTLTFCASFFAAAYALADDVGATSPNDFLSQVMKYAQSFGGLGWAAKVAGVVLLIISTMKVSFFQGLWAKLGAAQTWVAPVLGLIGGLLSLPAFSWAGITAYVLAGGGAVFLHELCDSIKQIPGLGVVYVTAIDIIEKALGGAGQKALAEKG